MDTKNESQPEPKAKQTARKWLAFAPGALVTITEDGLIIQTESGRIEVTGDLVWETKIGRGEWTFRKASLKPLP